MDSEKKISSFEMGRPTNPAQETPPAEKEKPKQPEKDSVDKEKAAARSIWFKKEQKPTQAETKTKEPIVSEKVRERVQEHVTDRIESLHSELISLVPESTQFSEAQADLAMMQAIEEKLVDQDIDLEPAVEAEYQRIVAEIRTDLIQEQPDEFTWPVTALTTPTTPPPPPAPRNNLTQSSSHSGDGIIPPKIPSTFEQRPLTVPPRVPTPRTINTILQSPQTTSFEREARPYQRRVTAGGAFLIGYVVGRHGERKRSEKRLRPVLEQHDTTVNLLEKRIADREQSLRRVVREQQFPRPSEGIDRSLSPERRQNIIQPLSTYEASRSRQDIMVRPMEILASTALAKEVATPPRPEAPSVKKLDKLDTPKLLDIAESIRFEGVTVRRLYETNQLDRQGLEAVVRTHLRGGNIEHVLDRKLLGKELQRERAHEFRHEPPMVLPQREEPRTAQEVGKLATNPEYAVRSHLGTTATQPQVSHTLEKPTNEPSPYTPVRTGLLIISIVVAVLGAVGALWLLLSLR